LPDIRLGHYRPWGRNDRPQCDFYERRSARTPSVRCRYGREHGSKPLSNQISFRVQDVAALKAFAVYFEENSIPLVQCKTHGNALSIYIQDPEGNTIEVYCHTPWHIQQPVGIPLDLTKSDAEILVQSEELCRLHPSFKTRDDWSRDVALRLKKRIGA
jgi:catechol 2,3-dioxygenase